ncbi:hypothetical protein C4R89_00930 [Clostridioides difficile]|nr:hypothetical protein [Clostridioides difficile]MDB0438101.1 hypothetical protein [Clostridioides difficile]
MKLKRKIITIFLSCFLVVSSTISSFAFAPVALLAPEVISCIATTLVCAGVKFADYSALNKSVRDVYESEGFITKCLPQLENDIKSARDGVVTLSKTVVDFFKDIYFPKVYKGTNLVISNLPIYHAPENAEIYEGDNIYDSAKYPVSPTFSVPFNSDVRLEIAEGYFLVHYANKENVYLQDLNGYEISYAPASKETYTGKISLIFTDNIVLLCSSYSGKLGNFWNWSAISVLSRIPKSDYATWENSGGLPYLDVPAEGTLDIPVAGDVVDLVGSNGWNPSVDQVWNPSKPVDIPEQGEGDLVIPGDSIIDTPIDPPVDPPIDPPINPDVPIIGIDFGPFIDSMNNFKEKFPFSLPWDFKRVFDVLNVPSKSPNFNLPLAGFEFNIEFSQFDLWIRIFKYFIYLIFVLGLIFITNKLKP